MFLFNDALNTFYLRLYGVRHMVKDHPDSEKGNPLPPHRLLFPINSKGSFYMHHRTDRIAHCYTSHGPLAGTRNSSMGLFNGVLIIVLSSVGVENPQNKPKTKSSPCGGSGFPLSLSEWSFTIC